MSSSSGNQNVIVTADGENSFDSIVLDSFSPKVNYSATIRFQRVLTIYQATTMVNEEETPSILFGAFYLIWKVFHLLLGSLYRLLHGQDFLHQPSPPKSIRPIFPRIHELPCEIRLLIFTECLRKRKDPDTKRPLPEIAPGLIPALRAHPKMYGEALQVYYKINFMVLSVEKCASLEDLTNDTLKYVRALAVHIRYERFSRPFHAYFSTYCTLANRLSEEVPIFSDS